MTVRRFFYDTEFIEDGTTIDLVSIGVVDETGREFYAVSTQFDERKAIPWVRRNVLDQLPPPADKAWRTRDRIRDDLLAFAGLKMLLSDVIHIDVWVSLGIIVAILLVSVVISLLATRDRPTPDQSPPPA